jgi:hypothetical protein
VLDQKIMNYFFHDFDLTASCLVDKYPHASLEGTVEVVRDKEFYFLESLVGRGALVAICHV